MDPDLAGFAGVEGFVLEIVLDAVCEFGSRVDFGFSGWSGGRFWFGTSDDQRCGEQQQWYCSHTNESFQPLSREAVLDISLGCQGCCPSREAIGLSPGRQPWVEARRNTSPG